MNIKQHLLNACAKLIVSLFLLIFFISNGQAEEKVSGFYLGAGVGHADQKDTCDDLFGSCDDTDVGWKVFGGYKFNRYFAVEGGSVDFGQSDLDSLFINVNTLEIVPGTLVVKIDGFFVSGLLEWPLGNSFSLFTKLGMIYWDIEFGVTDIVENDALVGDEDENGTDLFYGLGAQYNFTNQFGIRAEWEKFNNIGESEIGTTDIDLISGSLILKF